ncbi:cellulose biosynthesis cyclic di-GMP-binding regulatory protein BcsB [Trinickia diaoshuihuensis]|uniref:cellulose biosynthesis cyclic di-GMP-binding regulatory protein BcsB n=1 Tax=Trinickia diaoshuihuensis TaxID=2292265 RepID=UPI0013C3741C|nr:cellulose biosynthesis cyclic di-GMP-binding regulatory protein BcsB [Trinickia diaoshuihuensis]
MPAISDAKSFMVSRLASLAALLVLGCACATTNIRAQTAARPFTALRPASGPAAAAHALVVELAPREVLSGAHLAIVSASIPPTGSHYAVWVNGALAADVAASGVTQTLALAPGAFAPGVNTIQMALVPDGAGPSAALAVTDAAPVDDARSNLILDFAGVRDNPAPTLAQLPLAFDARGWLPRTVTVDLGEGAISPGQLRAASIAVQGVAARMRPSNLMVAYRSETTLAPWSRDAESWGIAQEEIAAGDVLLVGTRAALSRELPASVARAVTGPFVGIYPVNGGRSVAVVISGDSDADCARAARFFADSSASMPSSAARVLGSDVPAMPLAARMNVALAEDDPALVRAVLRFAALRAQATGIVADFTIRFSTDASGANLLLARDSSLPMSLRRHLPTYAPLQPGQAVSLPARIGGQAFVAIVGVRNAVVADAVDILRRQAAWPLLTQHATLIDSRTQTVLPLAVARRTPLAEARLVLADPLVFWPLLGGLLLASFVFVNLALKAQIAGRLVAAGERSSIGTNNESI